MVVEILLSLEVKRYPGVTIIRRHALFLQDQPFDVTSYDVINNI